MELPEGEPQVSGSRHAGPMAAEERLNGRALLAQVTALSRSPALQNRWLQGAGVAAAVLVVYLLTDKGSNPFNQYALLADAFLKGRLYLVDPPSWLELARYGDKAYVIDPPAPALLLMPFVAVWGTGINQVLVSVAVGAAATGLFWVAARQMGWSLPLAGAMTLLLALGTNFWWAATDGGLWTFAHVSAVFFMVAALVEATGSKRPWLVGLLLGLAGLSRLPVFLTFPFFAHQVAGGALNRQSLIRLGIFGAALAVMGMADLAYNYGRFGTLRDEGYYHPQYAGEPWFSEGRFDLSYIPRHINAIFFLGPTFSDKFPYFKPSNQGLALFFTTPALLYAFAAPLRGRNVAAIVAVLLTAALLVTHGTTGWGQFGYRFSLDVIPLLIVLTAAGMRHRLSGLKVAVILLSVGISLWGTLSFNKLDWVI